MRYIANGGKEYFIREAVSEEWDTAMELAFRVFLKYVFTTFISYIIFITLFK